jgi:DnaJ homolog subfamily A member 5
LFDQLAADEHANGSDLDYPSFGMSEWTWQPSRKGGECARDFYSYWAAFSTYKEFIWKEQWNLAEAPDRRVRRYAALFVTRFENSCFARLMERDNKKAKEDAKREYVDVVRVMLIL